MTKAEKFLSPEEESEIIEAIRMAEKATSGEIRVHIEGEATPNAMLNATAIFDKLGMANTAAKNGVLIYISVASKSFAILGDKGINDVVPHGFWNSTKDAMEQHFRLGDFKSGIVAGVVSVGEQLKKFFPWDEDDKNELPDEISRS
ncbi:MAG: TPM domain-containing protein [Cyclobacteriaceae bacterium]|nr:TPM domain-containing protein [Cyclobacteriaceae bacterium]